MKISAAASEHGRPKMSIGKLHKKKRAFSALFYNTVNYIGHRKLFVAIEAGTKFLDVFSISSAGVIHFVFFASAVGAFDFHHLYPPVLINFRSNAARHPKYRASLMRVSSSVIFIFLLIFTGCGPIRVGMAVRKILSLVLPPQGAISTFHFILPLNSRTVADNLHLR